MNVKGMIFDLDGTLLDSTAAWEHVGEDYLNRRHIAYSSNLNDHIRTLSLPQVARYFIDHLGVTQSADEMIAEICDMMAEQYREHLPLKRGVREFLAYNRQRGIPMCIATASDSDLAWAALRRLQVDGYFDFLLTCQQAGCGKDEPGIFLQCAHRLGLAPADIAVYEDSLYAMETASKAGFSVVGIQDGQTPPGELARIRQLCTGYYKDFTQLMNGGGAR